MTILDTDILTLLFKGHPKVAERYAASDRVAITIVSVIEILRGRADAVFKAEDGEKMLKAQARLVSSRSDLEKIPTILLDESSVAVFERLKLDKKIRKIGRGDILIACIALAANATLITRNVRDFKLVPNLRIENWAD